MHVLNDRICNNSVKNCALNFCIKMTGGMSSRTFSVCNVPFVTSRHIYDSKIQQHMKSNKQ